MEGRDIGTNVFPNADVKIYLDATPEERAKRRFKQNREKGIDTPYEEILKSIKFITTFNAFCLLNFKPDEII